MALAPTAGSSGHGARLARNSLANVGGRAGSILFWVLTTPFLLKGMGTERFGLWSLLFLFTTYMLIMDFGFGTAISRATADLTARDRLDLASHCIAAGNTLYAVMGAVFFVATWGLGRPLLALLRVPESIPEAHAALMLSALAALVTGLAGVAGGVLQGLQRQVEGNLVNVVMLLPTGVGLVLVISRGWGLLGVLWVQIGAALVIALIQGSLVYRYTPGMPVRIFGWNREAVRELFGFGLWMQATNLVNLFQLQVDKLFLAPWVGLVSVASFELGFRVANGLFSLPILSLGAVMPAAAQLAAQGESARLLELHRRGMRWLAAIGYPLLAATWVAGPWLVRGWLGHAPAGAVLSLRLLAITLLGTVLTGTGTAIFRGEGRPALECTTGFGGLILHLGLSAVMIRRYGLIGGLVSQAVAACLVSAVFAWRFHRAKGWRLGPDWLVPQVRPAGVALVLAAIGLGLERVLPSPESIPRIPALLAGGGALLAVGLLAVVAMHGLGQFSVEDRALLGRVLGNGRKGAEQ